MKRAIPPAAYRCSVCRSRCSCHNLPHTGCPDAQAQLCEGGCGRLTTEAESCRAGFYCRACAHPPPARGSGAWQVQATIPTAYGWRRTTSSPATYSDARKLGNLLEQNGARTVRLLECAGPRPNAVRHSRGRMRGPGQLDLFNPKKQRRRSP